MKNNISINALQAIALAYGGLYLIFIFSSIVGSTYDMNRTEGIMVYLLFVFFVAGLLFSWYNKFITGIIFLLWNVGMWILELFVPTEKNSGGFGVI